MANFRFVSELFPGGSTFVNVAAPLTKTTTMPDYNEKEHYPECVHAHHVGYGKNKAAVKAACWMKHFQTKMVPDDGADKPKSTKMNLSSDHNRADAQMHAQVHKDPVSRGMAEGAAWGANSVLSMLPVNKNKSKPLQGSKGSYHGGDDSKQISTGVGINFVILVIFMIAVVVAAIYSFKFNTLLGEADSLGIIVDFPKAVRLCADLMVPTWLFIMTPFLNLGLAGGLAVTVSNLRSKIDEVKATRATS